MALINYFMSNKLNSDYRFWIYLSVSLICGLAAGVFGGAVSRYYSTADYSSLFATDLNLSNLNSNNSGLIIRDPKKVVVNQDVKIAETVNSVRPVIVGVYKEIPTSTNRIVYEAEYYNLEKPLFNGLIITADGWAMGLVSKEIKNEFKFKNYIVIGSDRQIYRIDKISDFKNLPGDPLVFHLAGAANLATKKILTRPELSLGETLLVINSLNTVWPTTLASIEKTPAILNSETINARLSLFGSDSNSFKNSLVFDLSGNLAAVVTSEQEIIPAFSYNNLWRALSTEKNNFAPVLGVNYLDLNLIKTPTLNLVKGAWLYASGDKAAVIKDSPAQLAGLKEGDVITWINNQEIDANNDLADILSNYKANDKIVVTYWRAGVEKEVELKLGVSK